MQIIDVITLTLDGVDGRNLFQGGRGRLDVAFEVLRLETDMELVSEVDIRHHFSNTTDKPIVTST